MNTSLEPLKQEITEAHTSIQALQDAMSEVIIGQKPLINSLIMALLTGGHILLEGLPGLAKTLSVSTLAKLLKLSFQRIQFTPDLLPSDLIGNRVFSPKDLSFSVKKGPLFANCILADEINRSPAKVQSALLEAMQEKQVTIGEETFALDVPFLVMATENPVEQEGTYSLPEAQVDRFLLKVLIGYPSPEEELSIIHQAEEESKKIKPILGVKDILHLQKLCQSIYMDVSIKKYITDIVFATRPDSAYTDISSLLSCGASPRASIGLMKCAKAHAFLEGRAYTIPDDVKAVAHEVLRHRLVLNFEAQAEGVRADLLISRILDTVKVP